MAEKNIAAAAASENCALIRALGIIAIQNGQFVEEMCWNNQEDIVTACS